MEQSDFFDVKNGATLVDVIESLSVEAAINGQTLDTVYLDKDRYAQYEGYISAGLHLGTVTPGDLPVDPNLLKQRTQSCSVNIKLDTGTGPCFRLTYK